MQRRKVLRPLVVAIAAMGAVMAAGTAAQAEPAPTPVEHQGNTVTCDGAGLSGDILFGDTDSPDDASGPGGEGTIEDDVLTVTINAGYTASGIVVKGSNSYNVYSGPFVGEVTIDGLVSPVNESGEPAGISHWFVCGEMTSTPPPTTEPPTTPPTTTKEPELPVTGAGLTAVVVAGLALVGGGTALLIMRRRRDALENPAEL